MGSKLKLFTKARELLVERYFTEPQIDKIIKRLHNEEILKHPKCLTDIIDTWNLLMSTPSTDNVTQEDRQIPKTAVPPKNSIVDNMKINMNTVLADVEPDLLLLCPDKLTTRHRRVQGLGLTHTQAEHWLLLFNAPRGFYLQDWMELTKKIYYIEHNLLDFLYEKKDQKSMNVHPLIKSAAATEMEFDHIRARYLFAMRSGYKSLSHLYSVQMALDRPTLKDVLLSDNETYLSKFAPYCTKEEYNSFCDLIKNHDIDEDDANVYEKLAELNGLSV